MNIHKATKRYENWMRSCAAVIEALSLPKMPSVANAFKISDHQVQPALTRRQDVTMLRALWLEKQQFASHTFAVNI
jgi:hypothetical protein